MTGSSRSLPRLILTGSCGRGKSTIVEKAAGKEGLASATNSSHTRCSREFPSQCLRFVVVDTPGSTARGNFEARAKNSMHIATAFCDKAFNSVVIVVAAEHRFENTIQEVEDSVAIFRNHIPNQNICICVTHMDRVSAEHGWTKSAFLKALTEDIGLMPCIFCGLTTPNEDLCEDLLKLACNSAPLVVKPSSDKFLDLFGHHLGKCKVKLLNSMEKHVGLFEDVISQFLKLFNQVEANLKPEAVFAFQSFAKQHMDECQTNFMAENNLADEIRLDNDRHEAMSHVIALRYKLRPILISVFKLAYMLQKQADTEFRKCPHCGLVWTRISGCPDTRCGNVDWGNDDTTPFATFRFWVDGQNKLYMKNAGRRVVPLQNRGSTRNGIGCGAPLNWDIMPLVTSAELSSLREFKVEDVPFLQDKHQKDWQNCFGELWNLVALERHP